MLVDRGFDVMMVKEGDLWDEELIAWARRREARVRRETAPR